MLLVVVVACLAGIQIWSEKTYLHRTKQELRDWLAQDYQNLETSKALFNRSVPIRPVLIELLKDRDERIMINALQLLAELHATEAVQAVIPLLSSGSWRIRFFAAQTLGRLGDPTALDALLAAWKIESEWKVSRELAVAIANLGNHTATPVMLATFQDSDPQRKIFAAIVLLKVARNTSATAYLKEVLATGESRLKKLTLWTLAETEDPKAVELLEWAAQDADPEIREKAQGYLR